MADPSDRSSRPPRPVLFSSRLLEPNSPFYQDRKGRGSKGKKTKYVPLDLTSTSQGMGSRGYGGNGGGGGERERNGGGPSGSGSGGGSGGSDDDGKKGDDKEGGEKKDNDKKDENRRDGDEEDVKKQDNDEEDEEAEENEVEDNRAEDKKGKGKEKYNDGESIEELRDQMEEIRNAERVIAEDEKKRKLDWEKRSRAFLDRNRGQYDSSLRIAWTKQEERDSEASGSGQKVLDKGKGVDRYTNVPDGYFPGLMGTLQRHKDSIEASALPPPEANAPPPPLRGIHKAWHEASRYQNMGQTNPQPPPEAGPSRLRNAPSATARTYPRPSNLGRGILHGGPLINHTEEVIMSCLASLNMDDAASYEPPVRPPQKGGSHSQSQSSQSSHLSQLSQLSQRHQQAAHSLSYQTPDRQRPLPSVGDSGYYSQGSRYKVSPNIRRGGQGFYSSQQRVFY
ncbi:hypothetical protein B0T14DRAFT_498280 [Immersiella caudata]|uniref:Uncharacterized protein n=1 Tax=Immersiella caudata TaxID=314043 RepID=A0AA39WKR4_9PEZI|nr:hypothetical protein B0T14DRAFT_498280 [Immersiella caudata]